jgi:spoIIIJ-associated protein
MSVYQEFSGKSVEEALRAARESFGVDFGDLDFEVLTPGSRGVLGMGAEPARILAAPRSALGGAAPKREAAAAQPLPPAPPREREYGDRPGGHDRGDRHGGRDRRDERGPRPDRPPREPRPDVSPVADQPAPGVVSEAPAPVAASQRPADDRGRRDRGPRRDVRPARDHGDRGQGAMTPVSEAAAAEIGSARASLAAERAELQAAEASPEALQAGQEILEELMRHLGYKVRVDVVTGETSRLDVHGADATEREALGALIGRKGERLSALQHLVNLMLSKRMGEWTRVLVDVEDYRGRRERQLRELAKRAAARVAETGRMLQLEPMPALERRWIHLALRDDPSVATQSVGEEPERRVVVLPRVL